MNTTLRLLLALLFTDLASGQGQVNFSNVGISPPALITTGSCSQVEGPLTGANKYRIGLYVAPFGTTQDSLFTLAGLATNQSGPFSGTFAGAFPFTLAGYPGGVPISFQIRAWQLPAGFSYEEAIFSGFPQYPYLGTSARGFIVPSANPEPAKNLFGNGYGQVPGFTLRAGLCAPVAFDTNVSMNVARAMGGTHTVSWSNSATSYLLEWSASVPSSNQWQAVVTGVQNNNGLLSFTTTNASARFYRLRRL